MLGLTQKQLAELIGVTYQQAHKYENGINRVSASRLHNIAQALGVEVDYLFEGANRGAVTLSTRAKNMMLDLAQNFLALAPGHQQAVVTLARKLAEPEA